MSENQIESIVSFQVQPKEIDSKPKITNEVQDGLPKSKLIATSSMFYLTSRHFTSDFTFR